MSFKAFGNKTGWQEVGNVMAVVVVILVDMVKKVRHPCIGIDSGKFAAIHHSCTSRWHSVSCLEIR